MQTYTHKTHTHTYTHTHTRIHTRAHVYTHTYINVFAVDSSQCYLHPRLWWFWGKTKSGPPDTVALLRCTRCAPPSRPCAHSSDWVASHRRSPPVGRTRRTPRPQGAGPSPIWRPCRRASKCPRARHLLLWRGWFVGLQDSGFVIIIHFKHAAGCRTSWPYLWTLGHSCPWRRPLLCTPWARRGSKNRGKR
jgi:hypothetical protein